MRVAVIGNPHYPGLDSIVDRLGGAAVANGIDLVFEPALARHGHETGETEALAAADLVLTLGGDGTLLRGARMAGPRGTPVLGCNLGRLGFLTLVARDELEAALVSVASGDYVLEERLSLRVRVRRSNSARDDGREEYYGVNDAVLHKSGFARLITLRVWADDDEVGHYSADGIIVATATGSTAYSLSAGGPILVPTMDGIVATPISPHMLAVRPVVFPGTTRLTIELLSGLDDLALTVDGQTGCTLDVSDRVEIEKSDHPLKLIRLPGHPFFSVLRAKLHWGDVRPLDDAALRDGADSAGTGD